jgi:hypothetical protein
MTVPADPPPEGPTPPGRLRWVHAVTDRVPTGWLAGMATAAFLAVTAAFGGLAAAAAPPVAEISPGETHTSDQFAVTVERAVLIDELPEAGISVEAGERVLAVVVTAENLWDRALPALTVVADGGVNDVVRIPALGEDAVTDAVARLDDAETSPFLQPRVPAELVIAWAVPADAYADGDVAELELWDYHLYTGQLVLYGEQWSDPTLSARLSVEVTDVGAGADAQAGADG